MAQAHNDKEVHGVSLQAYREILSQQKCESNSSKPKIDDAKQKHSANVQKWRAMADGYEKKLIHCIVNADNLPPLDQDIVVPPAIAARLEQVTQLSWQRPQAFGRGVLQSHRIRGALLSGPPGAGKTQLAKRLAKTPGLAMLAIAASDLQPQQKKKDGDKENMIQAMFSLGRKLHPCIVFLDEADAVLGACSAQLPQLLAELDRLHAPFLLLATRRPSALDPAVLRRVPMHIHLERPTGAEREDILARLLRDETLDGPTCASLAEQTHGYTGSDLENVCVQAATLAVAERPSDDPLRALRWCHFEQAMAAMRPRAPSRGEVGEQV